MAGLRLLPSKLIWQLELPNREAIITQLLNNCTIISTLKKEYNPDQNLLLVHKEQ